MSEHEERLTDHDYDGILEYDNPMPGWWKNIFWVTVIFSILYFAYYHVGPGPSAADEYAAEMGRFAEEHPAIAAVESEQSLQASLTDPELVAQGAAKFAAVCAACHGQKGEGLIGPNLTDEYYLHGQRLVEIFKVVATGVVDKGMPSWEKQLSPAELRSIVVFLGTLRGKNIPGKAPQGESHAEVEPVTGAR